MPVALPALISFNALSNFILKNRVSYFLFSYFIFPIVVLFSYNLSTYLTRLFISLLLCKVIFLSHLSSYLFCFFLLQYFSVCSLLVLINSFLPRFSCILFISFLIFCYHFISGLFVFSPFFYQLQYLLHPQFLPNAYFLFLATIFIACFIVFHSSSMLFSFLCPESLSDTFFRYFSFFYIHIVTLNCTFFLLFS